MLLISTAKSSRMPSLQASLRRKRLRVAIAVRTWAAEESVAVWNWASKYFINVCFSLSLVLWRRNWRWALCGTRERGPAPRLLA